MNIQDPLTQILKNALSGNDTLRKEAESQITNIASENIYQFLLNISSKISNENEEKSVRQISAILIKDIILKNEFTQKWLNLNDNEKNEIKNHILSSLASSDIDIRKAAGIAIASICKIEIPNKQWLNIFDTLINTSQNENLVIQLSSIITLGFIFTEIKVSDISQDIIANILNCFYTILKKENLDLELHNYTLQAILNFIPFISAFIKNETQNIFFFELIKKSLMDKNELTRKYALQIFMELIILYYDYFSNFINQLFEVTQTIMSKDIEENALLSYEIWCNIAEIESNRIKNNSNYFKFCDKYYLQFLPILFQHLKINDYDSDEWNLRKASSTLISLFSECCEYQFIDNILKFIGDNINNNDNNCKNISLLTFGSILNTIHHDKLINTVKQSLQMCNNFLCDNSIPDHLKEISSWCVEKICENYGIDFVNDYEIFGKIIELIVLLLPNSKKKVCIFLCSALNNLVKNIKIDENQDTNILSPYVKKIMNELITLASRNGSYDIENNVSLNCFYSMGIIVEFSAKDVNNVIITNCNLLCEMFEKTLDNKLFSNNNMKIDFQSYILINLYSFILFGNIPIDNIKKLYSNIILSFQQRNSVYEEGISVISAIVTVLEKNFNEFMPNFLEYLLLGLNSINEFYLCKYSIHCTSVIIRSLGDLFSNYINKILPCIINILSNNEIDRNLKPDSFNIISDLFYSCPKETFCYFDSIMNLLGTALKIAMINNSDDSDIIEYFQELREHILENLTCIFSAIVDINKEKEFLIYVKPIIEFMNRICLDGKCYSVEIYKSCLGLYGDFSKYYGVEIKSYLNIEIIKIIIQNLEKSIYYNSDSSIEKLINYSKSMVENVFRA